MRRPLKSLKITRRKFAFWIGFGLFNLSEVLRAEGLDNLAAAAMRATEVDESDAAAAAPDAIKSAVGASTGAQAPEHWRAAGNKTWTWYERETFQGEEWRVTGITTPINRTTGEAFAEVEGYLDLELVPENIRFERIEEGPETDEEGAEKGEPDAERRARHGRPPSRWLRSLKADELRTWLATVDPPEAGVSGMTFWTHLTRDHSFDPDRILGLTLEEQAKLHAAAHHGY